MNKIAQKYLPQKCRRIICNRNVSMIRRRRTSSKVSVIESKNVFQKTIRGGGVLRHVDHVGHRVNGAGLHGGRE